MSNTKQTPLEPFARHEWLMLIIFALSQVSHFVDFMIIMPLGPQLMPLFNTTAQTFGWLVAAYSFSAAAAGLMGASIIQRFNAKSVLLSCYALFMLSTLGCGLANSYWQLFLARTSAGAFGGLLTTLTFIIMANTISYQKRGRATGIVMMGFPIATVAGVPASLWLAKHYGWHMPFFVLAGISAVILFCLHLTIPTQAKQNTAQSSTYQTWLKTFKHRQNWFVFAFVASAVMSAFSVIPYLNPYIVNNLHFDVKRIDQLYLIGGICTLITAPIIGRISDILGKHHTYRLVASLSILVILWLTHLEDWLSNYLLVTTTLMFILMSGRNIPAMALCSEVAPPNERASFMSITNFFQQLGLGLGTLMGGSIITTLANHQLQNYGIVGWASAGLTLISIYLVGKIKTHTEQANNQRKAS